ncbi:osmoprotectant transport system ATP-binding protein [Cerasibacillus quisquiliarum]|uniref:Quaternary amine transport ATP-binding protein n=1 Tax=Cerasibacillus quisquiliarum TaxID=227865 RepID=A0A511UTP0_9BACI|nr:ABC transporter ATP-binding protein [Cerasibacillus quisquiliarum]MBB5145144.1 osmoprotectant transport system ATP-binding protein [Cerasibacillus quisquiliarum]GEN29966.1 glycine/betaine ABC transporter ATP-binding protein [Cerasibacillus quisquiliarum]
MITFEHVSKTYPDGTTAVRSINLNIQQGEFFVIIGPSGSGKTTVLKMINRLIPLTDGSVYINQKNINDYDIHELRWQIGYVLQQIALFPHMTIEENIAIVPELKKWPRKKTKHRVEELLKMVGLNPEDYLHRKPAELSGGQQQRIGVIRALAANPNIVLMDEPFSALDPITREKLQDDIKQIQKSIQKTTVFVTHDMQEALKLADRICLMKDGEIVQVGTPEEIVNQPANQFVRDFVGDQAPTLKGHVHLDELLQPIQHNTYIKQYPTINNQVATIENILEHLKTNDQVIIEKNGELLGIINRQAIIDHLAKQLQNGGNIYE